MAFTSASSSGVRMRAYSVTDHGHAGYTLDLIIDNEVIATLPYRGRIDAEQFGSDFVQRERQAAMARHPAGKRLAE